MSAAWDESSSSWRECLMLRLTCLVALSTLVTLLAGCAPAATPSSGPVSAPAAPPAAPKVLNLVGREGMIPDLPGQAGRTPLTNHELLHDRLTARDASEKIVGVLAEAISVDNGTWTLNPDGTMVTTWKLQQ